MLVPTGTDPSIDGLREALRRFVADRDWEQFHSPKNLAMALSVEAAELLEHFQWMSEAQSRMPDPDTRSGVQEELADVFLYLILLADKLDIDLLAAAADKIVHNEAHYPAEKVRGSSKKYTEY